MDLEHVGEECSKDGCYIQCYLPIKCDGCYKWYCEDHCSLEDHSCTSELAGERIRMIACPICETVVRVEVGQQADAVMEEHIATNCKGGKGIKKEKKREKKKHSCSYKGCEEISVTGMACRPCGGDFCVKHRYTSTPTPTPNLNLTLLTQACKR